MSEKRSENQEISERKRLPPAIEEFFSKIESDRGLQAQVLKISEPQMRKLSIRQEFGYLTAVNKLVEIAKKEGYDFTAEEFLKVRLDSVEGKVKIPPEEDLEEYATKQCCHYAQGCMPGFCPIEG